MRLNSFFLSRAVLILSVFLIFTAAHAQEFRNRYPKANQVVNRETQFQWNVIDSANAYTLQISRDLLFANIYTTKGVNGNETSLTLPNENSRFYWRVIALRNGQAFDTTNISIFKTFNVGSIDSLNLWIHADTGIVLSNGRISTWNDLSDSALSITASSSRQALWADSTLNFYPAAFFDASTDFYDFNIGLDRSNLTIISVYNSLTVNKIRNFIQGQGTRWAIGPRAGSHSTIQAGKTISGKTTIANQFVVHSVRVENDSIYNHVNDSLYGKGVAANPPGTSIRLGFGLNGYLAEMIMVDGLISDSLRSDIDNYLMDKYAPPINLGPDRRVCSFPDSLEVNIDYALDYQWSTGGTGNKITVNTAGKYYLTITDMFERESIDSLYIEADTLNYQINFSFSDTTICAGDSLELFAGSDLYTYSWNTGQSSNSIKVGSAGKYKVSVVDCKGGVSSDSVNVLISNPVFNLGSDTLSCFNELITIAPDSNFVNVSYQWSTGETANSILADTAGDYILRVTDNGFSCAYSDTITVGIDSSLFGLRLGNDTSLCAGNSIGLVNPISGIDSYVWSTGEMDSSIIANTSQNFILTLSEGQCQLMDSIDVTIKGVAPTVGFTIENNCFGDSILFSDTSFDQNGITLSQWQWNFGDGNTSSLRNPKHYYDSARTYTVELSVENDSACVGTKIEMLSIDPKPTANFSIENRCQEENTAFMNQSSISSGTVDSFFWDFGDLLSTADTSRLENTSYPYSLTGNYSTTLITESDKGCLDTVVIPFIINPKPTSFFTFRDTFLDDTTFFTNMSSIAIGDINTYNWDFGDGRSFSLIDTFLTYKNSGRYTVSLEAISDSSCSAEYMDTVIIPDPPPSFQTAFPKLNQIINGLINFSWNNRDSATDYTLQIARDSMFMNMLREVAAAQNNAQEEFVSQNQAYYWRVIALRNGQAFDTTNISIFKTFNVGSIDSLNLWIHADTGIVLSNGRISTWNDLSDSALSITASSSRQALWEDSILNFYPAAFFDASTDFYDFNIGLDRSNLTIISVYNSLTVNKIRNFIQGQGTSWAIGPRAGSHNTVQAGKTISGKTTIANQFVVHSVRVENDSIYNHVNDSLYGKGVAANPLGTSIRLGFGLNGYLAEMIMVDGLISDSLRSDIDNYLMDKYAPPIDLGPDRRVCSFPDSLEVNIDYALDYQWSTGDTGNKITANTAGKYYLTITDMFERKSVDSMYFILDTISYQVDLGFIDSTICLGDSIELIGGTDLYSYSWSTNETTNSIQVKDADVYKVSVEDCKGGISRDSITLNISNPVFDLGLDTISCFNSLLTIAPDSTFTNVSYQWSTGETTASILADTAKEYRLRVIDNRLLCEFSDTIQIGIDSSLFGLRLGNDTSLCAGNSVGLVNPIAGIDSYKWSTGETDSSIIVNTSQKLTLTLNEESCELVDSIDINIKGIAPMVGFLTEDNCFRDSIQFTDTSLDVNNITISAWQWNFGDGNSSTLQNPKHYYDSARTYTIELSVQNDSLCTGVLSKEVVIHPKPIADFSTNLRCEEDSTQFIDKSELSSGSLINYHWVFGTQVVNADTSILSNPIYQFPAPGSYSIELRVESDQTCKDTVEIPLIINPKPEAFFTFRDTFLGDTTFFMNTSTILSGSIDEINWDFGNGVTSNQSDTFLIYKSSNEFIVNLRVVSDSACTDEYQDTVIIPDPPPSFQTVFPKYNQTINGTINFSWNERDSANNYIIQVATDSAFSNLYAEEAVLENNRQISFPDTIENYYWRVLALIDRLEFDTTNISIFKTFNISSIDSLNLWIHADSGVVLSNDRISIWNDLSDSAVLITEASPGRRPLWEDSILNYYPAAFFDRSTDFFNFDIGLDGSNLSIISVYNTLSTNKLINFIQGSSWAIGPRGGSHNVVQGGRTISGKPTIANQFVVHSVRVEDDSIYNHVNDSLFGKGVASNPPGTSIRLGFGLEGYLAEMIMVDGLISDSLRSDIDHYLMDKYAPPIDIGPDRRVCSFPDSIGIEIDYALSYEWSTGSTEAQIEVNEPGKYYLTVTDMFERRSVDSMYYILDTLSYQVNLPFTDSTICLGDSIELRAGSEIFKYNWDSGESTNSIQVKSAGLYKVSVEDCLGRMSTDSAEIRISSPEFSLGLDTIICFNGIISLAPDSNFTNVSYQWSTGEESISILADTTAAYSLTVSDNQYGCQFTNTVNVVIDSNIFGLTLGNDTSLCAGNLIGLQNPNSSIRSYLWTTGNTQAVQEVDTSGFYQVEVSNGRCFIRDTIGITITAQAPEASFISENFCLRDTVIFSDLSNAPTGDTLISWNWTFDDGSSSNQQNPEYEYYETGVYNVLLQVETDKGCIDTISAATEIYPKPESSFDIFSSCAKDLVFFDANSTIESGNIVSYFWNFGDPDSDDNLSTFQNPAHTFDTSGLYTIELINTSDRGCLDTAFVEKRINPAPNVNYTTINNCLNDSTEFVNLTTIAEGEIVDYLWVIDGNLFSQDTNTKAKFENAGRKNIILRATSDSNCVSTLRTDFEIFENPIANFAVEEYCIGIPFEPTNTSLSADTINEFFYSFAQKFTSFEERPSFTSDTAGTFDLDLRVTTNKGCLDSITIPVNINPSPIAAFRILNNGSGIPFKMRLENNSEGAVNYQWKFGTGDESTDELPIYTYQDTGEYQLQLKAISEFACLDSTQTTVVSRPFFLDAAIQAISLQETVGGAIDVIARLVNTGNNTIEQIRITADLNNQFQFTELLEQEVFSGDVFAYQFKSSFRQEEGRQVDFVCVRIETVNGVQDSIASNNELCEKGFKNELLLNVYPNPVEDYLTFEYVLPSEGELRISLYNTLGQRMISPIVTNSQEGYYNSKLNVSDFLPGAYFYSFVHKGVERQGVFIKK